MLFTFCKGVEINISSNHLDLLHHDNPHSGGYVASSHASSAKHLLGLLLALGSCFSYAFWLIVQVAVMAAPPPVGSSPNMVAHLIFMLQPLLSPSSSELSPLHSFLPKTPSTTAATNQSIAALIDSLPPASIAAASNVSDLPVKPSFIDVLKKSSRSISSSMHFSPNMPTEKENLWLFALMN
ncbi:hypothetical protein LWI29_008991 [Acer saccharum]|uniref:Uncharacterized protein n=1 Tax=Acer saccharum TaxID=4024 RepID=A0AA39S234_ACESA|nr:hypothetical protein LWI29_008991 [Acer saccharum]